MVVSAKDVAVKLGVLVHIYVCDPHTIPWTYSSYLGFNGKLQSTSKDELVITQRKDQQTQKALFFLHHGIAPRRIQQNSKREWKAWLRTPVENSPLLTLSVGRCVLECLQEREGELKELLDSHLKKHQKTAKNIIVNNINLHLQTTLYWTSLTLLTKEKARVF